ncbi:hypothetical protein AVEN_19984-1, partial [Araneus ventricosus]
GDPAPGIEDCPSRGLGGFRVSPPLSAPGLCLPWPRIAVFPALQGKGCRRLQDSVIMFGFRREVSLRRRAPDYRPSDSDR